MRLLTFVDGELNESSKLRCLEFNPGEELRTVFFDWGMGEVEFGGGLADGMMTFYLSLRNWSVLVSRLRVMLSPVKEGGLMFVTLSSGDGCQGWLIGMVVKVRCTVRCGRSLHLPFES